jgi:hypothetical protein
MRLARLFCSVPWLFAACATAPPPVDPLAALPALAASDLSCPQHLLVIAPVGNQTFAETRQPLYESVEGCSMTVIYVATKQGYVLSRGGRRAPPLAPDHVDVR